MPKSFNQKLKILYLMKILQERTDREHPITARDLISVLASYGINAERKAIYDDIEALRVYGLKIGCRRGNVSGYYLKERTFELQELKLLMDAVQSSRFITKKQTQQLLEKLESLTSTAQARKLQGQTAAESRVKTPNEEIYQNVEVIYEAIEANRQISFQYYEWTTARKLIARKKGQIYRVSPWKMIWDNDCYYLLGVDELSGIVKYYRVDKMMGTVQEKTERNGAAIFRDFDLGKFSVGSFGMLSGRDVLLKMEFENHLIGEVMDRFGQDAIIFPIDEEHFSFQGHTRISGQFFGWLAGLGSGARIISPEKTRREYIAFLKKALKEYE